MIRKFVFLLLLITLPVGCTKKVFQDPPIHVYHDFDEYMNAIKTETKAVNGYSRWITPTRSMVPLIHDYDWVVMLPASLAPYKDLKVGDVVAYDATWTGHDDTQVLHRIQGSDNWGWIIGGDGNATNDPEHVTEKNYLGKCVEIYRFERQ